MFGRLKDWRRIAKRYDQCSSAFFSAIARAAIGRARSDGGMTQLGIFTRIVEDANGRPSRVLMTVRQNNDEGYGAGVARAICALIARQRPPRLA